MLIQTEVGRAEVVAKQLAALPGVSSVGVRHRALRRRGRASAPTPSTDLQSTVVPSVQQVTGITRTLTCPIADGARP